MLFITFAVFKALYTSEREAVAKLIQDDLKDLAKSANSKIVIIGNSKTDCRWFLGM